MKNCSQIVIALVALLAIAMPAFATVYDSVQQVDATPIALNVGNGLAACGSDVYNNTDVSVFQTGSLPRWNMLDDGQFPAGTAPVSVGCINFGFVQNATGNLYVQVAFYDVFSPAGPACNSVLLGSVLVNFGSVPTGAYTSGLITLPTPIAFPDNDWAVQMSYFSAVSPTVVTSASATVAFCNAGPTVGTNDATVYCRDASGNGLFECPGETRSFAAPNKAQFLLQLQRVLPTATEQSTWGTIKSLYR